MAEGDSPVTMTTEVSPDCSTSPSGPECDPCSRDSSIALAEGFCIQCDDYLCSECLRFHRKFRAWQSHSIQPADKMVRYTSIFSGKGSDLKEPLEANACGIHNGMEVDQFCKTHHVLCCPACCEKTHSKCNKAAITELASGYAESSAFKEQHSRISKIYADVKNTVETYCNKSKGETHRFCNEAGAYAKDFMNRRIDAFVTSLSDKTKQDQDNTDLVHKAYMQKLLNYLSAAECRIDSSHYSERELFIFMHRIKADLDLAEEQVGATRSILCQPIFISVNTDADDVFALHNKLVTFKSTNVVDVNVKEDGEGESYISAIQGLSDGRFAITDRANNMLKVYSGANRLELNHKVERTPTMMVEIKEGVLGMVFEGEKQVHSVTLAGTPVVKEFCSIENTITGLACGFDKEITVSSAISIVTVGHDGKVKERVSKDNKGQSFFTNIVSIAVNGKTGDLYVVDKPIPSIRLRLVAAGRRAIEAEHQVGYYQTHYVPGMVVGPDDTVNICTKDFFGRFSRDLLLLQKWKYTDLHFPSPIIDFRSSYNCAVSCNVRLGKLYIGGRSNSLKIVHIC